MLLTVSMWRYHCWYLHLQISNNCHPGIGLDQAAAEHIQEILICLFFELLEYHPQTIEDMERNMRTTLPASMFHWVMQVLPSLETSLFVRAAVINIFCAASDCADVLFQFQNTPEALHRIPRKKLHDKRNANSKSLMSLLHMLQPKLKVSFRIFYFEINNLLLCYTNNNC